jgi:hypothetical protein
MINAGGCIIKCKRDGDIDELARSGMRGEGELTCRIRLDGSTYVQSQAEISNQKKDTH